MIPGTSNVWLFLFLVVVCVVLVFFLKVKSTEVTSIKVKLYALCGIIVPELEENRWHLTRQGKTSDSLLIAFGGGAMALMQIPRAEFLRTFESFGCDKLFLTDPDQSWYLNDTKRMWKGIEEMNQKLSALCSQYKYVIAVGNCMGASAALMFAPHFDYTLTFIPQINLVDEKRWKFRLGGKRVPRILRESFHTMIADSIRQSKGPVVVHCPTHNKYDVEQLSFLPNAPNLEVIFHQTSGNNIAREFQKRKELVPLVSKAFEYIQNRSHPPSLTKQTCYH